MLQKFLQSFDCDSDSVFLKCSARYIPLFSPRRFFPFWLDNNNTFSYSFLARKAICHSFLCNMSFLRDFVSFSLPRLDDSSGSILESVAFDFIMLNRLESCHRVSRSLFYPMYDSKVLPGTSSSRRFSSSLFLQFLRSLACLF